MNNEKDRLIVDLRATLGDALARIDALVADPGDAGSAVERANSLTAVGGPGLDLAPRTRFLTETWRDAYRPGRDRGVYVACCSDLKRFEKRLDLGKPGTGDPPSLAERLEQIRRDRTGSPFHDGTRYFRSADGWTDWFARAIWPQARARPCRCGARTASGPVTEVGEACPEVTRGKRVDRAVGDRGREALVEPRTRTARLRRGRGE